LLESKNLEVLEAVCALMSKLVSPELFSTEQLIVFATAPLGPVAKLGLGWLKTREIGPLEILRLAQVRSHAAAKDAVALARERLAGRPDFTPDWLLAFLDSPTREVRDAA